MARRPLVARFSADTSRFRSELANTRSFATREFSQIAQAGNRTFQALEGSSAASAASMASSFGRAFLAIKSASASLQIALVGFTVAAAAGAAELENFHRIAERARGSNVGTTYFQAFTVAARALRMEVKDLQEDMAGVARASRDAFDGDRANLRSNRARELLQERFLGTNDFGQSTAPARFDAANTMEGRIRAVLTALRDMEAAGQQLAAIDLAERLGMRKLAEHVQTGRASFAGFLAEVQRLEATGIRDGSLISPELIRQGEGLRDRFAAAGNELSNNLRPILDECARLALLIGSGAAWSAEQFAALIGVVGRVVQTLRDATVQANALQGAAARAARIQVTTVAAPDDAAAQAQAAREVAGRRFQRGTTGQADRLQADMDNEAAREAARARGLGNQPGQVAGAYFSAPVPDARPVGAPPPVAPSAGSSAKATDDWADAYRKLIETMERANATSRAELATVGATTAERERALAIVKAEAEAKKNGKTLTDEQRAAVGALAAEHGRLKDQITAAQNAQKGFSDALQWTGDQLVDMVGNARSLSDISRALQTQAFRAVVTGQGPFAPLLGMAPAAGAPQGSIGGLLGLLQPQQISAPIVAGMGQAAQGMQPLMLGAFNQVAAGTQQQFGTVFTGLGTLLQMVLSQSIMSAQGVGGLGGLGAIFGSGGGGGGATLSPFALFHGGGVVGGQASGMAPASLWNSAPRFHSGLRAGELRAVLQQGERVLTQSDSERTISTMYGLSRAASGGGSGGRVSVNVHNYSGAEVNTRDNGDGSIDVIVEALEGRLAARANRREGSLYGAIGRTNAPGGNFRGL